MWNVPRNLTPFPSPGAHLLDSAQCEPVAEPGSPASYTTLLDDLRLTRGSRVVFHAFLLLGLLAGAVGTGAAVYNVEWGGDPDQVLGLQIAFSWAVVAIVDVVLLATVVGVDVIFRGLRRVIRGVG